MDVYVHFGVVMKKTQKPVNFSIFVVFFFHVPFFGIDLCSLNYILWGRIWGSRSSDPEF